LIRRTTSSGRRSTWQQFQIAASMAPLREQRAPDPVEQAAQYAGRPARREMANLAELDQRERLEQLVERPEPPAG
jgi:hypothetical protein